MRSTILISGLMALGVASGAATPAMAQEAQRKPDLADAVEGVYEGDVTSDSRGSSQSDVTVTVKRIGKNLVQVSCDYARIPTVQIPLTRPMDSITAARGDSTFLIETKRDPNRLDLYIDGAALVVRRQ